MSDKKKLISSELRDDHSPVFLSEYPAEDDVEGWLNVYRSNDPLGIFNGRWADDALTLIQSLRQRVKELEAETQQLAEQYKRMKSSREDLHFKLAACEKELDELKSARPVCIGCCKVIDEAVKQPTAKS